MRYILASGTLSTLDTIRTRYESEKKINLDTPSSIVGLPIFLGGTNVIARREQIFFLEKIKLALKANLLKEEEITTPEQWYENFIASQIMIAACLFIQTKIKRLINNSTLYRLIDVSLGITTTNYLDEEDIERCYVAADKIINSSTMYLKQASVTLETAKFQAVKKIECSNFSQFLSDFCRKKNNDSSTHYPITSITQPLFGKIFLYTGATIGYLGGELISQSTKSAATRNQLVALIGNTIPLGTTAVMLFAPIAATKLLTTFCSFSLAHILGKSMELLGQGVGVGVGMPFDISYLLIDKTCALIKKYHEGNAPEITGWRIADGTCVLDGIIMELTSEEMFYEANQLQETDVNEDGEEYVHIDFKLIKDSAISPSAAASIEVLEEEKDATLVDYLDYH